MMKQGSIEMLESDHSSRTCALCTDSLTDKNVTREHIIPNSIGGRSKTKGFICNSCNSKFGEKWEAVLASQFNWFALATGINRERGDPPNLHVTTVSGEKLLLRSNGSMVPASPVYKEHDDDGKIKINIQARTIEEAKKIVKGVAKKYPSIDQENTLDKLVIEQRYLSSPLAINLQFGGPFAGRSMVKTALAFASECGVRHEICEKAINYLRDEEELPPFGFCYLVDLIPNRPTDTIFHCVAIKGDPTLGKLLAYVEYFNIARIVVELSDKYSGIEFMHSYAIDPVCGKEIDINIDFSITEDDLGLVLDGDGMPLDRYEYAVNHALPIVLKRNSDRERHRVVAEATEFAFQQLGVKPNENLPQEKCHEFVALMMEKLMPFIEWHARSHFDPLE